MYAVGEPLNDEPRAETRAVLHSRSGRGRFPVLVLTRRANQSIMIGDDVVVTVLDVRGDQVRIGIKAPRSVDVHREEVFVVLQRNGGREHSDQPTDASPDDAAATGHTVSENGVSENIVSEDNVIDLDRIDAVAEAPAPVVASPE